MLLRAFTLIEVLVTIGIITLLASLAMPGIKSVRESSRSSECATRLRQLSIAAQSYSNVFRGVFPPAILFEMTSSGVRTVAWDFAQGANGEVLPGPLWSFTDHPFQVQQCPAFIGSSTFGADPYTGFNYNTTFIGAEGSWPIMGDDGRVLSGWKNARRGLTVSQHNRPAETALFGDGGWQGGANKYMRAPSASVEMDLGIVYSGAQAFRHQGCTNVAWLDGHVRGVCQQCKGMHAATSPADLFLYLQSPLAWPANGFLSNDDSAYDPR